MYLLTQTFPYSSPTYLCNVSQVKLYLKDANRVGLTPVYALLHYNGKKLKLTSTIKVDPKHWNKNKQQVKQSKLYPECNRLNADLQRFCSNINEALEFFNNQNYIPEPAELKSKVKELSKLHVDYKDNDFWFYFDQFIEYKRTTISPRTLVDYNKALRKHLTAVEDKHGVKLTFGHLRASANSFADKFIYYLTYEAYNSSGEKGFSKNSVGKQVKNLRVFLNWCFDREITPRFSLKHMPVSQEQAESIWLTESEIKRLEQAKSDSKLDEAYRDIFLLQCETGLRYSDVIRITKENISGQNLQISMKKTGGKVIIPISSRSAAILSKFDYNIPTPQNITLFNKAIRRMCELAGIDQSVVIEKKHGNKLSRITYKKHELISSHTARRSFCTNKFLKGMPAPAIMPISGHKTERAFMRYLKIDSHVVAEKYRAFF